MVHYILSFFGLCGEGCVCGKGRKKAVFDCFSSLCCICALPVFAHSVVVLPLLTADTTTLAGQQQFFQNQKIAAKKIIRNSNLWRVRQSCGRRAPGFNGVSYSTHFWFPCGCVKENLQTHSHMKTEH
jgi:hypothetical protein